MSSTRGDKILSLSMCSGPCARRARDSMARLRQSSVGRIPATTNKLSIGVGEQASSHHAKSAIDRFVNNPSVGTVAPDTRVVSAAECTRAKVAVCNVVAPEPQADPANRLQNPTRVVNFLRCGSWCRRNVT